jgi:hypothetical protein
MTDEEPVEALSEDARRFRSSVGALAADTVGVRDAIAVSADGLLIAASDTSDPAAAQRLAAVVSGLISLSGSAARGYGLGGLHKVVVDLTGGLVVVTALSPASVLGVVADDSADIGTIAYEMTLFASRVGHLLAPPTIRELKNAMAAS